MRVFAALTAIILLTACTATGSSQVQAGRAPDGSAMQAGPEPGLPPTYRVGSGDQLRITVFGENDLSGGFFVDGSGAVSMPLNGWRGLLRSADADDRPQT